jgi:actin-related protein 8
LRIPPEEGYELCWPVVRGRLNVSPSYPLSAALNDLEKIWRHTLITKLGVQLSEKKDFSRCAIVLVVPDLFDRQEVRHFLTILVTNLHFKAVLIYQESVCATFGSGLMSACVVDIGDQKTSISCVDEGLCLPNTRYFLCSKEQLH